MPERKIMVEVTEEELQILKNGFQVTQEQVFNELLKCCGSDEKLMLEPVTGNTVTIKEGNFCFKDFSVRFTIKHF